MSRHCIAISNRSTLSGLDTSPKLAVWSASNCYVISTLPASPETRALYQLPRTRNQLQARILRARTRREDRQSPMDLR